MNYKNDIPENWDFYEVPMHQKIWSGFDKLNVNQWYRVKSNKQKEALIDWINTGAFPDAEFNADYTKFRRVEFDLVFDLSLKKK